MKEAVIVSAARTPIGSFGGAFQHVSAVDLGKAAVKEAVKRAGLSPEDIEETVLGNVLSAGLGQNVARQIAVHAGLPHTVPAMTINKVCGSGLRSVSMAAQFIKAGDTDIVLAGGAESMSNAPYVMPKARWGTRMGSTELVDTMLQDGLMDSFEPIHMGITAENIAERWSFSRREQDEFALRSQQRAAAAIDHGYFDEEIVAVDVPQRKGDPISVSVDEHPKKDMTMEKLERLRPAFKKHGTVTAGNASGLNDGAAALVVMSKKKADALGLKPLAKIVSYGNAALDPSIMGYGPVPASRQALERAGLTMKDIDLVEANEAFASQSLAVVQDLEIDADKINVNGGAIALGHPIGASGARVLTSLLYEMKRRDVKRGLAALCIGGGQGTAIIVER